MRVQEMLKLTGEKVDEKAGVIRLKAEDVKEKAPRVVPISHNRYVNLNENHLKEVFKLFPRCSQEPFNAPAVDSAANVSQ